MQPIHVPADPQMLTTASVTEWLAGMGARFDGFAANVLALDPQEAAIRIGLTALTLAGAFLLLTLARLALKRLAPSDATQKRRSRIGGWTMAITRLGVYVGAALIALSIWGVDLAALLDGPLGVSLALAGRAALTIVLMLAAIEIAHAAIVRVFARIAENARSARRAAQVRTIAPMVSGVATTVLIAIAMMMVLAEVGVEIGPLLAGAGIVGLAVGFGAQTLVKDFLTGIFLLVEDTVSIGDIARIGECSGVVEDMSLRTIKLRAFDGTLQVIPYGEAQIIQNMTKTFSYYVFELSVSYSSNLAKALEVMKETGDALQQDKEFADLILEPIEIFGVDQLADSGVVLKARFKTYPTKQWTVGREYLKRIKLAFDAAGIEIPFPHLKLVTPDQPISIGGASALAHP